MPISEQEFEEFEGLVRTTDSRKERQCQKFLHYANTLLLPTSTTDRGSVTEVRHSLGSTDFVVFGDIATGMGPPKRKAFIWELKAPQCFLFERDDSEERCRVTKDFVKGENQLLHYFHQANRDDLNREKWQLGSRDDIHFGGIIIGSADRIINHRGDLSFVTKADLALNVRIQYLYLTRQIRVLTWDAILDFVRPT